MAIQTLDRRRREVLVAVIAEYVRTAEPVGSRAVARRHIRGLSPATIRNVMADLDDMGYLIQPHTSAGRVPTDKAYRFYVDHLEHVPWVGQRAAPAERATMPHAHAAERLTAETPGRLSLRTHMTGMLLAPPLQHTALDRIELGPLGDERALAVIVTDTGWVTVRAISLAERIPADDLREIGRALTRRYRGKTFRAIVDDVAAPPSCWITRTCPTSRPCARYWWPSRRRRSSSTCSRAWPPSAASR